MMHKVFTPVALFAALAMTMAPIRFPAKPDLPELTAEAWIVVEVSSGLAIAEHNADEERAMASVTKLMTALVVRDHSELDERIRISEAAADIGEAEGDQLLIVIWNRIMPLDEGAAGGC